MQTFPIILTGDRPTGPLHLGHLVGSLQKRVELQDSHRQFILIADLQALTDHADEPQKIRANIHEVLLDYLAVGIDPDISTICLQSQIPALSELTMYLMNLVSVARVARNPTVKTEISQKGMGQQVPVGFFSYPVSQAADISAFQADLVPVGDDQLPMVELCRELVKRFNRTYGQTLNLPEAMLSKVSRLPGTDGQAKMGKSLGNAIFLQDDEALLRKKVMKMYTDPDHIRVSDPGKVEGNPVFTYLDAFAPDLQKVRELKAHYQKGGLGDVVLKKYLFSILTETLAPIRKRRVYYAQDRAYLDEILQKGTEKARQHVAKTMDAVRAALELLVL
ncbi:MAG: tryptophan--tRNA ligase [Bacteroidota bacterium]